MMASVTGLTHGEMGKLNIWPYLLQIHGQTPNVITRRSDCQGNPAGLKPALPSPVTIDTLPNPEIILLRAAAFKPHLVRHHNPGIAIFLVRRAQVHNLHTAHKFLVLVGEYILESLAFRGIRRPELGDGVPIAVSICLQKTPGSLGGLGRLWWRQLDLALALAAFGGIRRTAMVNDGLCGENGGNGHRRNNDGWCGFGHR